MCRLLGVVTNQETDFKLTLREAPRSLANLSREHPHGWGIAVFDPETGWMVQRLPECAHDCPTFHEVAVGARGEVLLAHVRLRTVGETTVENTHPFKRGRWVFAHNGTIKDLEYLRAHAAPERIAELEGQTDSELFFAYLLTRFDAAGCTDSAASDTTDRVLREAVSEVLARPDFGAINFLLSDGETFYAHRFGRTLFLLERGPRDQVREVRESMETGAIIETHWHSGRRAVLLASEHVTDEPWQEVAERTLLRVDREPIPHWRALT